ncbi:nonsense-mediated mRNA decay factor SMG7-like [Salvia hispanica]|uniref:nonsense-mediated mRNA decay factor SMG7-like n=1 Tax=Salvia hispanica TaxID=49212 RepID=UPI00200998AC|nr:nonsense-mediated mRNA decay factor SMG7-like [Salvia hispanica]XP_047954677.1 nonsense-mediated mRNA decay factor SMG7-like [Salvia hispanica]
MELQKSFLEVVNAEKQMLELIYKKGILHEDVLELYHQIRAVYENILLNSNHLLELQEVEHHMWKLHYELIVEFRRRARQRSHNGETKRNNGPPDSINSQTSIDKGLEEIKSFLSKSTEFYMNLIVKMRRACGLPAKVFLNNTDRWSSSIEPNKLHACQHTCHRLLICLGDLARYTEIIKKPDACEWSTAAMHYLEATRTWPDSGNPHNQLALLATYVGDPFLALYHCIRSLAVKEPFPDAWKNILLLFEENRSAKLISFEMQPDFLNPSKRGYLHNKCLEKNGSAHSSNPEDLDNICSEKFDLWPILVRTISFLLIRSSLEEYPCTLASALHSLDTLLAVDDTKLTVSLESYQRLDSSRRGPYRAIQVVSIFIFIVHSLTESVQQEDSPNGKDDDCKHSALSPLAFATIFIFMGRLTERCVMGEEMGISPLLPSVLVFVEWLAGSLDMVQTYDADERVRNAMSYFFNALVDLSDRIEQFGNRTSLDHTALWEDHELRGFYPLNHVHVRLDFTTHLECVDDYRCRNKGRLQRIVDAAKLIKSKSRISPEKTSSLPEQGDVESVVASHEADEEKSVAAEEEEVILFKPITRRNSAPLYISKATKDPSEPHLPIPSADEWLRRATSLSAGQNGEDADSFSFCPTTSNSGDSRPTGPPSLSGWVLSKASSSTEREKEIISGFSRQKLSPIDETASTSFNNTRDPERATAGHISTIVHDSPPYVAPVPSAPVLPDDASWIHPGADGILGAAPLGRPAFVNGYPPVLGMSSSEWLYHYRNSGCNPIPVNEVSSFELCDQWGNRLVSNPMVYWGSPEYYVGGEEKRERMFLGYQRPYTYGCGVGMEVGHDQQPPLLHYLKEKERQLQPPSYPTFMGN